MVRLSQHKKKQHNFQTQNTIESAYRISECFEV